MTAFVPTTLSSRWTPFYKFYLPALLLGGLGLGAWYVALHPEQQSLPPGVAPEFGWVFVIGIAVFVAAIMWWTAADLTRIELSDDELCISNYRTEIRVALNDVEDISGPSVTNPRRYTITFAEPTEFGSRVTFIPPMEWSLVPLREAQVVAELRNAWADARAGRRR